MKRTILALLATAIASVGAFRFVEAVDLTGPFRAGEQQLRALRERGTVSTQNGPSPAIGMSRMRADGDTTGNDLEVSGNVNLTSPDTNINLLQEGSWLYFHEQDSVVAFEKFGGSVFGNGGVSYYGKGDDQLGAVFYNSATLSGDPGEVTDFITLLQSTGTLATAADTGMMLLGNYSSGEGSGHTGATLTTTANTDTMGAAIVHLEAQPTGASSAQISVVGQDGSEAASLSLSGGNDEDQITLQTKSGAAIILQPNGDIVLRMGKRP